MIALDFIGDHNFVTRPRLLEEPTHSAMRVRPLVLRVPLVFPDPFVILEDLAGPNTPVEILIKLPHLLE